MKAGSLFGLILTAALVTSCSLERATTPTPEPPTSAAPTERPSDTATPLSPTAMTGCVSTNSLRIRDRPSKDGTVIAGLNRGKCVTVTGRDESATWVSIRIDKTVGWVALEYLALQGDPNELQIVAVAPGVGPADLVPTALDASTTPLPPTKTSIPTATKLPPTATRTATNVPPTATPTATKVPPTATHTATNVPPTATPTATKVPPTATRTATRVPPTATRTATRVPPTPTDTEVPVTEIATSTDTALPPTPSVPECGDTASRIGQILTCRVQRAVCSYHPEITAYPTFCTDAPKPANRFTMVTWGSDWSDLDGQCILVTGVVIRYEGALGIVATSRSQVTACR